MSEYEEAQSFIDDLIEKKIKIDKIKYIEKIDTIREAILSTQSKKSNNLWIKHRQDLIDEITWKPKNIFEKRRKEREKQQEKQRTVWDNLK